MTDDDLAVGGVRYERLAPMQSWRLTADVDRVALDLTFDALTPAVGVDGQGRSGSGASAATGAIVGKGHLEQAGRWSGWIDVDGTRHQLVDARGNRDKSWGPRRWGDGAHASIREWKVTTELADDGVTHTATHVHATDKQGRVHELDAEILRVSPGRAGVKPNTTIVNEGLARWHYNGTVGYGISEYLHQLDANARPMVPIE
jgi:hypothetical protein